VAEPEPASSASLREPLLAYAAAITIAAAAYWTGRWVGFVQQIMHGLIACAFLFGPQVAAGLSGRPFDRDAAGIGVHPIGPGLRTLGLALLLTWPAFVVGFFVYYGVLCSGQGALPGLVRTLSPICARWTGIAGAHVHLPEGFLLLALSQIIVVAIPEEVFFRGYLLSRFEERWPSRLRLWGARVGRPLMLSSALFALGHFLVDFQPARLAVFFPALAFGWMRSRSGSIAAGATFHALCNLLSEMLHESFF
jgi:membrane protease YdiL (CAAX protease family)